MEVWLSTRFSSVSAQACGHSSSDKNQQQEINKENKFETIEEGDH